jgi:hypothetical protein
MHMEKDLRRRLVPNPKRGGSLATALPAAPATLPVMHLQVLRCERMPLAARVGYTEFGRERVSEHLKGVGEAHDTS